MFFHCISILIFFLLKDSKLCILVMINIIKVMPRTFSCHPPYFVLTFNLVYTYMYVGVGNFSFLHWIYLMDIFSIFSLLFWYSIYVCLIFCCTIFCNNLNIVCRNLDHCVPLVTSKKVTSKILWLHIWLRLIHLYIRQRFDLKQLVLVNLFYYVA